MLYQAVESTRQQHQGEKERERETASQPARELTLFFLPFRISRSRNLRITNTGRIRAMEDRKGPAIRLFGKTILPWMGGEPAVDAGEVGGVAKEEETIPGIKKAKVSKHETSTLPEEEEEGEEGDIKREENESSTANSSEKYLKSAKNLPCPRCSSKNTKFCYFNNYSINQPRHYCKNCLRYWTSGGVMRNLPIGAGRRKNKTPSCIASIPNEPHHPLKPNEKVLSFGSEAPPTQKNSNDIPYFNGAPCSYPWSFPVPFYPVTAYWSIPWLSPPSASSASSCSELNSIKGEKLNHRNSDKGDSISGGLVLAKDFQCKGELKYQPAADSLKVMCANPVAFSLSLSFQESS